jgi:hypothetical protein
MSALAKDDLSCLSYNLAVDFDSNLNVGRTALVINKFGDDITRFSRRKIAIGDINRQTQNTDN